MRDGNNAAGRRPGSLVKMKHVHIIGACCITVEKKKKKKRSIIRAVKARGLFGRLGKKIYSTKQNFSTCTSRSRCVNTIVTHLTGNQLFNNAAKNVSGDAKKLMLKV